MSDQRSSSTADRSASRAWRRRLDGWVDGWNQVGVQAQFYGQTHLRQSADVVVHYRIELVRLIAQMGLGTGALAVIGGTVAIVGFLTLSTGALVAVQGYNQFSESAWRR